MIRAAVQSLIILNPIKVWCHLQASSADMTVHLFHTLQTRDSFNVILHSPSWTGDVEWSSCIHRCFETDFFHFDICCCISFLSKVYIHKFPLCHLNTLQDYVKYAKNAKCSMWMFNVTFMHLTEAHLSKAICVKGNTISKTYNGD